MKKTPDFSATLAKGASEAREILEQTATLIDAEWQRLLATIDESETVPDQVKQAVDRFETVVGTARREASTAAEDLASDFSNTIDEMRDFVTTLAPNVAETSRRAARQFGVPVPNAWPWDAADGDKADGADVDSAGENDNVDDVIDEPVAPKTATKPAAKTAAKTATKAKKGAAKTATKAKKGATKTATKTAAKAKTGTAKAKKSTAKAATSAKKATTKTATATKATAKKATAKKATAKKTTAKPKKS